MTILCVICEQNIPEANYPEHMATAHSGKSQLQALAEQKSIEQDIPKVIPLSKDAPIPPEMQEVLQQMERQPEPRPTPAPQKLNVTQGAGEPKVLKLKYVWEGNCPQDNTPVRTVITKVDGRWFATAYCITHAEIEQQEVTPLNDKIQFQVLDKERATGEDFFSKGEVEIALEKDAKNEKAKKVK